MHSILSQTLADFNLLVLDNNSNDGTLQWIQSLNDERINLYPSSASLTMEENWARIKNIEKNAFMTIIGHDDILHPHYLSEMNALIEKHPDASLYQAHYSFINAAGDFLKHCLPMDEVQHGHEFLACQFARTMDSMGTGYLMRTSNYDALGGIQPHYPNLIFADYQLWTQLSLISYKATTNKECFSYRLHESISKKTNGESYQLAFEKYIYFLAELMKKNTDVRLVIERYGQEMLMYHCESLSHRLLKTPVAQRKTKVKDYVEKCRGYASMLLPGQAFDPSKNLRIRIAEHLDNNVIGRSAFNIFKNLYRK